MRHRLSGRKFSRTSAHRKAMLQNLASSLILHEKINTTLPKAKDLRPFVEKLVTLCKGNTLHTRRRAISVLRNREAVEKLLSNISPRFSDCPGGYTRIIKNGFRYGDNAPMAMISFKDFEFEEKAEESTDDDAKAEGSSEKADA